MWLAERTWHSQVKSLTKEVLVGAYCRTALYLTLGSAEARDCLNDPLIGASPDKDVSRARNLHEN